MKIADYRCEVLHILCNEAHCLTFHLDALKHDHSNRKAWTSRKLTRLLGPYCAGLDNPRAACLTCPRALELLSQFTSALQEVGVKSALSITAYRELRRASDGGGSFKSRTTGKIKSGEGWNAQAHNALLREGCLVAVGRMFKLTERGEAALKVLERFYE